MQMPDPLLHICTQVHLHICMSICANVYTPMHIHKTQKGLDKGKTRGQNFREEVTYHLKQDKVKSQKDARKDSGVRREAKYKKKPKCDRDVSQWQNIPCERPLVSSPALKEYGRKKVLDREIRFQQCSKGPILEIFLCGFSFFPFY